MAITHPNNMQSWGSESIVNSSGLRQMCYLSIDSDTRTKPIGAEILHCLKKSLKHCSWYFETDAYVGLLASSLVRSKSPIDIQKDFYIHLAGNHRWCIPYGQRKPQRQRQLCISAEGPSPNKRQLHNGHTCVRVGSVACTSPPGSA